MTLQEFFESLSASERLKIQFWPRPGNYDAVDIGKLQTLQDRWGALMRDEWRGPARPSDDDVTRALQGFLGRRPLT